MIANPVWDLARGGDPIRRKDLHDKYGGVRQGGISPSSNTPNIFLFADPGANAEHGYIEDRWVAPDLFEYCGEGQSGHQQVVRYNKSVREHVEDGKSLRLFFGWRGPVSYEGEFRLDPVEPYYLAFGLGRDGVERRVVVFRLRPLGFTETSVRPTSTVATADTGTFEGARGAVPVGGSAAPTSYRGANEHVVTTRDRLPFSVDPNEQDRALQAHATAQNVLAEWVLGRRLHPLSPGLDGPDFDVAWYDLSRMVVAEVKSVRPQNEIRQLRMGMGQVLDYADQLNAVPLLFVDRRPSFERWQQLAARAGVVLAWPAMLESLADEIQRY
ncbi:hypothetical protein FE634_15450 [Nocardioides dongxiaopingii]|uniref:hypothetical protein n=1 Tax=Nocardioides sp. S-1144 TaxID=2582905 RepID=UPI00110E6DAD|nr:hypothetical protein [Nocardioides sp. S-1144]QCW51454.1 hypothetical protein FE634_15450 [Nocardioides sp. S-1144]